MIKVGEGERECVCVCVLREHCYQVKADGEEKKEIRERCRICSERDGQHCCHLTGKKDATVVLVLIPLDSAVNLVGVHSASLNTT